MNTTKNTEKSSTGILIPNAEQGNQVPEDNIFYGLSPLQPAKSRLVMLYCTGHYTQKKIAEIIGVSTTTITTWLMQPEVQAMIGELQKREFNVIESSLKAIRNRAVDTMTDLMDSPMDGVRFQAAKDVLDRTGHKPVTQVKVDKTVTTIEEKLRGLSNMTDSSANIIDISDVVELVKNGNS